MPRMRSAYTRRERGSAVWKLALSLWILFIWTHSLVPGVISSVESDLVVGLLRPLFKLFGHADADLMRLVVRKGAHFAEYALLGALSVAAHRPLLRPPLAPALKTALTWVLVPSIDETIQGFVPGRAALLTDVLLDMAGFGVGLLFAVLAWRRMQRLDEEFCRRPIGRHSPGVPRPTESARHLRGR